MKKILLLLLVAYNFSYAQNFEWAKSFGSTNIDSNQVVEVDDNGNSYTLGNYSGTIDCDPSTNTFNLTAAGLNDIFLAKLDNNGNFIWAKNFGGTGADDGIAIKIDNNGDIVIGGKFKGTSDFDPNAGITNLTSNVTTTFDIFVCKLTSQGELIWAKSVGSSSDDFLEDLAIDANNNIYSTGQFTNIVDFDPSSAIALVGTSMKSSTFIWKLTSSSTYVWAKHITSSIGYALTLTNTGVFFTGDFTGTNIDFNPSTTATANLTTPNSFANCYIARFDTSGNYVWAKKFGNTTQTNSFSRGFTINTDSNSNVFIGGEFGITTDFNPDATNVFNLTPANSNKDAFICKLNSSGVFVDAFRLGGTINDVLNSIEIDKLNNVYITGVFGGANVDFNPGTDTFILSTTNNNLFLAKYTNTLNFIWAYKIGDTYSCEGQNLKVTKDLDLFISGTFYETADFDISSNSSNLTSAGQRDVFILKISQCPKVTSSILTQTNASCGNNGTATVTASGGTTFTYLWMPSGSTNATATNLAPNNYTCTITNECGNSVIQNVTIISETQSTIWNGTSWTNNEPTAGVTAVFASDYTGPSITACSLIVDATAEVIFTNGTVTLENEVSVTTGGTLTLNNNVYLKQNNNVTNTGDIIIKRDSAPVVRLDYISWASPVLNQNLLSFSPATLTNRFYTYNPSGINTSTAWISVDPSNTNFAPSNGYLVRTPNTWNPSILTSYPAEFIGVANNGDYSTAVTVGFNMIGNPYPSPLTANTFLTDNTAIGATTLYFWTHTVASSSGMYPSNNYASYTTAGGVAAAAGGVQPNGIINVGQGFFTNITTAGNAVFNNLQRQATGSSQLFKNSNTAEKHRIWLSLTSTSKAHNQILLAYISEASNSLDSADGKLFGNENSIIYNILNNDKYVIQAKALPFADTDFVALGLKTTETGIYTISLDQVDGLFANDQNVYLKDNWLNVTHNIKATPYTFTSEAGEFNSRFEVVYQPGVLSTITNEFNENSVLVYKNNNEIKINSGNIKMSQVDIFDMKGSNILSKTDINKTEFTLSNLTIQKQVLIVKITDIIGNIISKKFVYY